MEAKQKSAVVLPTFSKLN